MIRKRKKIDLDIESKKISLEIAIDDSVMAERRSEGYIASIKKQLSDLASETCFEETLKGRIKALEQEAAKKIDIILKELSEKTGKSYKLSPKSDIEIPLNVTADTIKGTFDHLINCDGGVR